MRAGGRVLVIAAALMAAGPVWAQSGGAQLPARRVIQLVRAQARLETYLDGKRAKPGDAIRAKLEASVAIPNGPTLPPNTMLEGHVDQAQASEHHSDSSVVVTFDQAKLKNGEVLPVKVTILAIAEPGMTAAADESPGPAPATTAPLRPGNFPPAPGTVVGPAATQTPPAEGGSVPAQAQRGVPGVTLQSDIHAAASATFVAERRNVHVPDGTELQIAVGVIPQGVQLR